MKRRNKLDTRAIVMMLFGLVAVVAIMVQMRNSLPQPPTEISQLGQKRIGIVDSTFINLPYRFMIKMPDVSWQLEMLSQDTLLVPFQTDSPVNGQIRWLVKSERFDDTTLLATACIGILTDSNMDVENLTITLLNELIEKFEKNGGRVRILQPASSPAHQTLKGYYFAIVCPDDAEVDMPVMVCALLLRGELVYVLQFFTTESTYPEIRQELEKFVQRFYPLPSTIK